MEPVDWSLVRCGNCRLPVRLPRLEEVAFCECPKCRALLEVPIEWLDEASGDSLTLFELPPARQVEAVEPGSIVVRNARHAGAADGDDALDDEDAEPAEPVNTRTVLVVGSLLALLAVAVFVGTLTWGPAPKPVARKSGPAFPSRVLPPRLGNEIAGATIDLASDYAGAVATIRRFLGATTLDEIWPHVRDAERVRPVAIDYYRTHSYEPAAIRRIAQRGEVEISGPFLLVPVEFDDLTRTTVAVEKSADGFKVDWESHVGLSGMDWVDFTVERPQHPVEFRATLAADNYYNYAFGKESDWECWSLRDARGDTIGYAYAPRDSPVAAEVLQCLRGRQSARMIVTLAFPSDSPSNNQVVVRDFIACGWIGPTTPARAAREDAPARGNPISRNDAADTTPDDGGTDPDP